MERVKEALFALVSSAIVILGLAFLNVFGIILSQVPLLFSAAAFVALARYMGIRFDALYVVLAAFAGLAAVLMLGGSQGSFAFASFAMAFAVAISLVPVMALLREKFIIKKTQ